MGIVKPGPDGIPFRVTMDRPEETRQNILFVPSAGSGLVDDQGGGIGSRVHNLGIMKDFMKI